MTVTPPHLAERHEQYPGGFPARVDDGLLGHWETPAGIVVVEPHPHGYEVHYLPCYDFENCDACSPGRGPSNPHTGDGHDFRSCPNRGGPILTVAGGEVGERAVLEYLAEAGSAPQGAELARRVVAEAGAEAELRRREREENEAALAEQESQAPGVEERFAALKAEIAALAEKIEDERR